MPINIHKKGIRVLGISESFDKRRANRSILTDIVMRADRILDGIVCSSAKIGGTEVTKKIIEMYHDLNRNDINLILLNGCVISWYNIVDLKRIAECTLRPIICVTYHPSSGLKIHS